jgi:hypothetical protein
VLAHHGPVAAAVDATNWQFYVGGVIQWNCDENHNHAVQVSCQTLLKPHPNLKAFYKLVLLIISRLWDTIKLQLLLIT